jgi:hypothetical protein
VHGVALGVVCVAVEVVCVVVGIVHIVIVAFLGYIVVVAEGHVVVVWEGLTEKSRIEKCLGPVQVVYIVDGCCGLVEDNEFEIE